MTLQQLLAQAEFRSSAARPGDLPPDSGTEVAFAGRSNAGKSSVLNRLCARNQLARTSKTPGRTQLINFFTLTATARLVDLPGYGYAKASQNKQRQWIQLLEYYFAKRQALRGTMLVMDIRHPLRDVDRTMLEWCKHYACDVHILLNKSDKLSRNQAQQQLHSVQKELMAQSDIDIDVQTFSAVTGSGVGQAIQKLGVWLGLK